jgi:Cft2 family RNA processing exonuclease
LLATKPDVVIANAGAAQFKFGKPITMSITDVQEISKILPDSKIIVVHLDVINHCAEKRDYCKTQIQGYTNIYLPSNGETMNIN